MVTLNGFYFPLFPGHCHVNRPDVPDLQVSRVWMRTISFTRHLSPRTLFLTRIAFCPDFIELLGCGASYHHRCHEQGFGKAHYFLSERVGFHGTYLALVRVPIASLTPNPRCTLPGIVCADGCPWVASVDGGAL